MEQISIKLRLTVMSGVDDGQVLEYVTDHGDGKMAVDAWTITIGRLEDCDIRFPNDTFISRQHANLHWRDNCWWLEDCGSRNGTFTLNANDFFQDTRVQGIVPVETGCLFRVGRTWLRLEPET